MEEENEELSTRGVDHSTRPPLSSTLEQTEQLISETPDLVSNLRAFTVKNISKRRKKTKSTDETKAITQSSVANLVEDPLCGGRGERDGGREEWGTKVDFLLSVIGFAVDLANVWRFPYLCYKNGGGAFLIPYCVMLVLGGIPLFFMELSLGQYNRIGAISCWGRLVPLFKGIGYCVVFIAFYVDFFYNVILAWSLRYLVASFSSKLPWASCNNTWNTDLCVELTSEFNSSTNYTGLKSPAEEYFNNEVLQVDQVTGFGDFGLLKWDLSLCLLTVYIICYFSVWKGISTSGKVVYFTAIFPYVVLGILFIRGITLPGAASGISYYLKPDFNKIIKPQRTVSVSLQYYFLNKVHSQYDHLNSFELCYKLMNSMGTYRVWFDAATQIFFSLGPGFGVLLAFASYNKFNNNVYKDALVTSCINCCTSFISGFVVFSVLGYMAQKKGQDIDKVVKDGPGLVFEVYPEALATMPSSSFFSVIFFLMLLTLGLDSSFAGSEAVITALSDEFPIIGRNRKKFVAGLFSFDFLVGLLCCTQGGIFVFALLEKYAAGFSILTAVFCEAIVIASIYGIDRLFSNIREMIGFTPGWYWRLSLGYFAPFFIGLIIVYSLAFNTPLYISDPEHYPWQADLLGWCLACSSVMFIPGLAVYNFATVRGSPKERLKKLCTPGWTKSQDLGEPSTRAVFVNKSGRLASPDGGVEGGQGTVVLSTSNGVKTETTTPGGRVEEETDIEGQSV